MNIVHGVLKWNVISPPPEQGAAGQTGGIGIGQASQVVALLSVASFYAFEARGVHVQPVQRGSQQGKQHPFGSIQIHFHPPVALSFDDLTLAECFHPGSRICPCLFVFDVVGFFEYPGCIFEGKFPIGQLLVQALGRSIERDDSGHIHAAGSLVHDNGFARYLAELIIGEKQSLAISNEWQGFVCIVS